MHKVEASAPVVYFHGTSSLFLNSIKVHGLDPALATRGSWVDPSLGTIDIPSRQTFGGIYFSSNLMTAFSSAGNTIKKGGNRLIIAAKIQEASALPDEDDFLSISWAVSQVLESSHESVWLQAWVMLRAKVNNYSSKYTYYYEDFEKALVKKFNINMDRRKDKEKLQGIMNALLVAAIQRKVSYYVHDNSSYNRGLHALYDIIKRTLPETRTRKMFLRDDMGNVEYKVPRYLIPAAHAAAERVYQKALDLFIKAIRNDAMRAISNRKNLRLLTPVKFRGKNRILCIMELVDKQKSLGIPADKQLIYLHYGKPPQEFFQEYASYFGPISSLVLRTPSEKVESSVFSDLLSVKKRVLAYQGFLYGPKIGDVPLGFVEEDLMLKEDEAPAQDKKPKSPIFKKKAKKLPEDYDEDIEDTNEDSLEEAPEDIKPKKSQKKVKQKQKKAKIDDTKPNNTSDEPSNENTDNSDGDSSVSDTVDNDTPDVSDDGSLGDSSDASDTNNSDPSDFVEGQDYKKDEKPSKLITPALRKVLEKYK